MSLKRVKYSMIQKNNQKIEDLKKIQDEIMTLDLTDEVSAFKFSMLFLDMMSIIKELETILIQVLYVFRHRRRSSMSR